MELENKIQKLQHLIWPYETKELLTFLAGILLQMPTRHENPFLKRLKSPLRQIFFLAQLNLNRNSTENKMGFDEKEWNQIASLLDEIETEYFYLLAFPRRGKETAEDLEKIAATMPTFMTHFFNGPLAYQEQEIEKIEKIFKDFEPQILEKFGLSLSDFVTFYDLLNDKIQDNLNLAFTLAHPDKWQEFTGKCIAKGLLDPKTWIDEAPEEIKAFAAFLKNPGSFLVIDIDKLEFSKLPKEKIEKIFAIFLSDPIPSSDLVYYTEQIDLLKKPFIKIAEKVYLPFFLKQYLNACYNFLWNYSLSVNRKNILKNRDLYVERKTERIFKKLFRNEGHFYSNYSIDDGKTEQDLLILYKGNALIIEVKASSYRAPMRDPLKAFDKLKSDFKKSIQYAYEQTSRVISAFQSTDKLRITNANKRLLYEVPTKRYKGYSIIVTLERFGHIQTNLAEMLEIADSEDYPWCVSLDDLEAFILTLAKRKNRIGSFLTFLDLRQNYHGHLICSDELEMCGSFLINERDFRHKSMMEETLVTLADLTEPIEQAYREGMGFENERYKEHKRDKTSHFLYQDVIKKARSKNPSP